MVKQNFPDKIIGIPSRQIVTYTVPTLIKKFDFFNKLNEIKRGTLQELSKYFEVNSRVLDAVLTYLIKEGFIERNKIKNEYFYSLTPLAKKFLLKGVRYDLTSFALLLEDNVPEKVSNSIFYALKNGKPADWNEYGSWEDAMRLGKISKNFSEGMMSRGKYLMESLSKSLKKILTKKKNLLDIGGSFGDYCGNFTKNYSNLNCSVFELPKVAELAKKNIENKNYKRVGVISGDMFKDDFPKDYDIHFYSNAIHDWNPEQIELLLKKSFKTLNSKGLVLIHDLHLDNDKKGPEVTVDHSLYLSIFTDGRCYTYEEIISLLNNAGFKKTGVIKTVVGYSVIFGIK